ncbi:MAG: hypothetical protein A2161_13765 [Candidatus Schekmanbacteria bacterium RBG_13_48_7]|uniref:Uncharacterized protein n=1 Tax=Candidatus Schekmanbacteria bacterium RBG_13_48_7 TaxID=1817878 RepID=A0A1F7S124_9BACT|nr:MAG: hypothetical protein A2161_13765 [Candidatus Schekmanbacteria bacterium RBG_13_48_7]
MKIENQVCSFKQAFRLTELGVKLDSYFRYVKYDDNTISILPRGLWSDLRKGDVIDTFRAYTVAELNWLREQKALFIPEEIRKKTAVEYNACAGWWSFHNGDVYETEVEASADSLIWLIENKYLKVEDLKL